MFVALHDLRFARGRFTLMVTVIVLVSFLVGFLAALTGGLARASTSAITDLPVDRIAFATPHDAKPGFTSSVVTPRQVTAWRGIDGVQDAEPLGLATTRASAGRTTVAVTALGVETGSGLLPSDVQHVRAGQVVLSEGARDLLGDTQRVTVGGRRFNVAAVAGSDASFAHTPVVWVTLRDWQPIGSTSTSNGQTATVVTITGKPTHSIPGMTVLSRADARSAIASYTSENGSLRTISGFLVAISALVISAFFSVWTVNRTGDIAVLKALGASSGYLLRDAIGQAALVLAGGVATGTALAWLTAVSLDGTLPVVVDVATLTSPAALLIVAGLVGAAAAIWRITRIDPHAALAAR